MKTTGKDSAAPAENRMNGNEIIDQKCWQFIWELNSDRDRQLDAVAMIDCDGEMTYRQMFRMWDRYAEVFSALGIVEKNRSRVGIVSLADLEPINVFYALNMLGVSVSMIQMPDLLDKKLFKMTIRKERITDIIVSDLFLRPDSLRSLLRDAEKWGIRHVIVLHSPISGEYAKEPLIFYSRINYCLLRQVRDALFMDDLLRRYAATPICYGSGEQDNAAAIIHTSGTTDGIHKPIPLSDKGLNAAVYSLLTDETFGKFSGRVKTILGKHRTMYKWQEK